jgi:hypothetical protein
MRLFLTLAVTLVSVAEADAGLFHRSRERRERRVQQCPQTLIAPCPASAQQPAPTVVYPDWRPAILPGFGQLGGPRGVFGPFTAGGCPGGICPIK